MKSLQGDKRGRFFDLVLEFGPRVVEIVAAMVKAGSSNASTRLTAGRVEQCAKVADRGVRLARDVHAHGQKNGTRTSG